MSPLTNQNEFDRSAGALAEERTLRAIATLPAPEGLEDRVKAGLRGASREGKVVSWPFSSGGARRWMQSAGMRAAAAAAIVVVIAGGGWEVYSHIQLAPLPAAVAEPQPLNQGGAFHAAGAIRVPQTLEGPVVAAPANSSEKQKAASSAASRKRDKRSRAKKLVPSNSAVR